jgi:hypothetical protein
MRKLYEIAHDIRSDWQPVYFGAKPYLNALFSLESINDNYHEDTAKSVVRYFLGNAQTWRGDVAKRIKSELKDML